MRLTLVNPNTSRATTDAMVAIAAEVAGLPVRGVTARFGAPLIADPQALAVAAQAVEALADDLAAELADGDAVIVAAFGDPGLAALRARLSCPVTGIAEAGMAEAAAHAPRFAVVTTTPALAPSIAANAQALGHEHFVGTFVTPGDPLAIMADTDALVAALEAACRRAIDDGGADAIVIGGGPLAVAARRLAGRLPVPLVEPVPAAVRLSRVRLSERCR
ncbi:aspartate/glutamate racemase family protein [Salinarimonas sp. NSM]|uniref:aspartate/glutamate racemase family protein n=1 Tax=Salinarimonas sp. NSM TaxID=3458003 RepID=UPI004036A875